MTIRLGSVNSRLPLRAFEGKFPSDGSDNMVISVEDAIELEKAMAWILTYSKAISNHLREVQFHSRRFDLGFLSHHNNAISTSVEVQLNYENWSELKDAVESYFKRTE